MGKCLVNGINLYWEEYGEGTPLLLIHGLGSSARDWELQIRAFARQHRVMKQLRTRVALITGDPLGS